MRILFGSASPKDRLPPIGRLSTPSPFHTWRVHNRRSSLTGRGRTRHCIDGAQRSKLLPYGGALDAAHFAEIRDAVRVALRFAQQPRPIVFDEQVRERWIEIYAQLSSARPGLAGAATARADADEMWEAAKERPGGLTRIEVSDMFSRNKKRREIERALGVLEDAGRLRRETRQADRGRSAEVWIPVLAPAA